MFPSTILIEFICLLFALLYVGRKKRAGFWFYLVWFMVFILLIEGIGWTMAVQFKKSNHFLYNIALPIEFLFITWILYNIFKPLTNSKPWIIVGLTIFIVSFAVESFQKNFIIYNNFSATLASILFVIASGYFFYLLLRNEDYVDLMKSPSFW